MDRQRLSHGTKKRIERIHASLQNITKKSAGLNEADLTELFRRASIPSVPDGYPAGGFSEGSSNYKTSPTEGAVLARQRPRKDLVKQEAERIEKLVRDAETCLINVYQALDFVALKVEEVQQRPTTTACEICEELPAEKAGMCNKDYTDWQRHGRPDRARWRMYKRKEVNSEKILLAPDCPPAAPGCRVTRGPWKGTVG